MKRRGILSTAACLALIAQYSRTPYAQAPSRGYNHQNAPDELSRQILSGPHRPVYTTQAGVRDPQLIHMEFAGGLERKFASYNAVQLEHLLWSLTPVELTDLTQLYVNSAADSGHHQRLLDLLALRSDGRTLGRVSRYLGFAPTYSALMRNNPRKVADFLRNSNPSFVEPTPGFPIRPLASPKTPAVYLEPKRFAHGLSDYHASRRIPSHRILTQGGMGQYFNFTPYELYLHFRTMPYGAALGPLASAYEASLVLVKGVGFAWSMGYAVGSGVSWILQRYAPETWNAIGGTLNEIVETWWFSSQESPDAAGQAQEEAAIQYRMSAYARQIIGESGGDDQIAKEWYQRWLYLYKGGSGGRTITQ